MLTLLILSVIIDFMSASTNRCESKIASFLQKTDYFRCKEQGNYSIHLSQKFTGATIRLEHPRPGMSVCMCDYTSTKDTTKTYAVEGRSVIVSSLLSGYRENPLLEMNEPSPVDVAGPCDTIVSTSPCEGKVRIKGGIPLRGVGVYLEEGLFTELLAGVPEFHPLLKALGAPSGNRLVSAFASSPQSQLIAAQMFGAVYSGPCLRMFLESKALELIAVSLHRYGCKQQPPPFSICHSDVERLHEARRLLFESMDTPPTLRELALKVGTNEFKLKKGFRKLFGCTVYQALRQHRMEYARTLLEDTDMTVGMIAAEVGYTNMSHFISAFRRHFGITPGTLLTHSRKNLS